MKTLRLLTIVLIAVLVISTWAPAPAYAEGSHRNSASTISTTVEFAKAKLAKLRVDNRTGGTLYVALSGPRDYHFATAKAGKTIFQNIEQGTYLVTVTSSACSGKLTYKRNFRGTVTLKPFICKPK